MQHLVTKELLFSYFAGRTTCLPQEVIKEWTKEPAHQERFYEWLHEWETQHPHYVTDVSLALKKFFHRIDHLPPPSSLKL
jgi:transmembrane sensor